MKIKKELQKNHNTGFNTPKSIDRSYKRQFSDKIFYPLYKNTYSISKVVSGRLFLHSWIYIFSPASS